MDLPQVVILFFVLLLAEKNLRKWVFPRMKLHYKNLRVI